RLLAGRRAGTGLRPAAAEGRTTDDALPRRTALHPALLRHRRRQTRFRLPAEGVHHRRSAATGFVVEAEPPGLTPRPGLRLVQAGRGAHSSSVSNEALPPAAVVLMVSVRSVQNRAR